jgi:hypothetical protein
VQQVDHVQISFSDVFVVAAISPIASLTSTVCSDGFNGAVVSRDSSLAEPTDLRWMMKREESPRNRTAFSDFIVLAQ